MGRTELVSSVQFLALHNFLKALGALYTQNSFICSFNVETARKPALNVFKGIRLRSLYSQ